jgi:hypothetical protein
MSFLDLPDEVDSDHGEDSDYHLEHPNWRDLEEDECEHLLIKNPFNNYIRIRLSQIWIEDLRNISDALKLISSILKSKPKFQRTLV